MVEPSWKGRARHRAWSKAFGDPLELRARRLRDLAWRVAGRLHRLSDTDQVVIRARLVALVDAEKEAARAAAQARAVRRTRGIHLQP
jgi:hypothetical protein